MPIRNVPTPTRSPEGPAVIWTVGAEEENVRLDRAVPLHVEGASRAQAKRWIETGRVRVNGRSIRPSHLLHRGEKVRVAVPPPQPAEPEAEPIPLDILHQDEDLLVLVKPAHIVVHPAPGHTTGTLVNALLHHCPDLKGIGGVARPGIVHRLDRGTSGLMLVAKNDRTHRDLTRQFASRTVEKRYLALVYGHTPERWRMERPIGRDIRNRKKMSTRTRQGRTAVTEVERLENLPQSSLLSVRIETGRTHQIRVHLSEAGYPIVGDPDYGRARRPPRGGEAAFRILRRLARPALHAAGLAFVHPRTGDAMRFEIPLPEDFQTVVDALRALSLSGKITKVART